MKRPSFQFYPADWSSNSNLRRCSHEEKGIWIDVMCLLHDQEEYGVARWSLKEIAQAIGCTVAKLKGLVTKGVLKGADTGSECEALTYVPRSGRKNGPEVVLVDVQPGPLWYSSRMVIDEYKRVLRGESGAAPKGTPDLSPKGGIGASPKATPDHSPSRAHASSSSSSSSSSSVNLNPLPPLQPESPLRDPSADVAAFPADDDSPIPETPATEGQWLAWFNREEGACLDPGSRFDRKGVWPVFSRWCKAGITQQQVREAIREARATATSPIANLPKYVDRVLENAQSPPRMSAADQSKLAAARAIFGTEIEGNRHGNDHRIIDVTPAPRALGG
jgi:hypothetical protein